MYKMEEVDEVREEAFSQKGVAKMQNRQKLCFVLHGERRGGGSPVI